MLDFTVGTTDIFNVTVLYAAKTNVIVQMMKSIGTFKHIFYVNSLSF